MPSLPVSTWLLLQQSTLAMCQQLATTAQASVQLASSAPPAGQADLALIAKSALDTGKQWQDLQADTLTSVLRSQLSGLRAQQRSMPVPALMALRQSLADDVSAQQRATLKVLAERAEACLDALCKSRNHDDVSVIAACFFDDIGGQLRASAEQAFILLNSANEASTVLTHDALDNAIATAVPR